MAQFLVVPSADVSAGIITSLSNARLEPDNVITASGEVVVTFATADISPPFTPTGTNAVLGPRVISGSNVDQILIVPSANVSGSVLTSISGSVVSTNLVVTGLLGGVAYRAVTLTAASPVTDTATVPGQFTPADWTVVDDASGGILKFTFITLPSANGSAITNLNIYENGSLTPIATGLTAAGTYYLTSRTNDVSYSYTVAAVNAKGTGPKSGTKSATPTVSGGTAPTATWGYVAGINYGASGNMFVDGTSGNDANSGTTFAAAKKTIAAAMAAWTGGTGGKIKIAAGTYNESVTVKSGAAGNPLIIEPYGTAAPVITCAEPMTTGWTLCTVADQPLVGANYGSIYKKTGVPVATFPRSDPMSANLFAGSTRLNLARKFSGGQNTTAWCRSLDYLIADSMTVVGGEITAYQHAAVTAAFTPAQLQKSIMVCQESPNVISFRRCTVSGANIVPASNVTQEAASSGSRDKRFGFINLLAAMEQGGWGYDWDGASATCDLYAWLPSGKTPADITYSARMNAFTSAGSNFTIQGLIIERMSGSGNSPEASVTPIFTDFGCALAAGSTGATRQNIRMENCWIRNGWQNNIGPGLSHCGGVTVAGCTGLTVRRCTFDDLQASEGITVTNSANVLAEWNKFDKVHREDFWPRGSDKVVFAHNLHTGSQLGHSHNNGVAFYVVNEGLEWGNIWKNATFFGTWQQANNIQFCYNVFDFVGSYNAIKDQSGDVNGFPSTIGGMIFNNTIVFSANRIWPLSQSINVQEGPLHPFSIKNNIYYGAVSSGTVFTGNGGNINNLASANFPAATGNQFEAIDTTFKGRASGDYSIGLSSVVRTTPGQSITAEIAALASAYPFFTDFTDAFGQPISTGSPKRGAMSDLDVNPMSAA